VIAPARDQTISFTVPATTASVEPEFGGTGWTINMLIPPGGYEQAIYELRIVREILEHFMWCANRARTA
jgi:hypothetical protein